MAAIEQGTEVRSNMLEVLPGYPGMLVRFLSGVIRNPAHYRAGNFRHPYGRGHYGACTGRMRKIRTGEFAIEKQ
ncbi:MAG: hypothetical protein XE10_0210 [Methanoculleus marisnigri]|jgi:DNA topoisomerase IB|uniref:Uncharacterized protein n=1 Tax=Methanoculleus marisnigri TaxID=2198 RepID=A0A117MI65_9EURY|nr:MAG: hypothetical protein XD82_0228 [Methanoculleus marisnigri]KUL05431.1 MAG: hypothetical protein XE10_0210 [Methanoculleus marisnigri]MDK2890292.1 hypothetical protein [Methanoculleus sp.]MDK2989134.1 hypothetical protein [Methanoculleus sp.]